MGYDPVRKLNEFTQSVKQSAEQAVKEAQIRKAEEVRLLAPVVEAMRRVHESGSTFGDEAKPLSEVTPGATVYKSSWYMGSCGVGLWAYSCSLEMGASLSANPANPYYFCLTGYRCQRLAEEHFQTAGELLDFALHIFAKYRCA